MAWRADRPLLILASGKSFPLDCTRGPGECTQRERSLGGCRDSADDDLRPAAEAQADNFGQVLPEMFSDSRESGVVFPDLLFQEHLHAGPIATLGIPPEQMVQGPIDPLADSQSFESKTASDDGQRRGLGTEDCARPERSHHFVVPHINNPKVAPLLRAVSGDRENDVGIDGRESDVNHFEPGSGEPLAKQDLEDSTEAERRLWVPHSCRLAQDENPDRVGGLVGV